MTPESIQAMIDQALLRNFTNGDGRHSSHGDNRRNVQTARPYFYADFMKCQPLCNISYFQHPNVTIPLLPDFGGVTDGTRAKNPSSLSDIHARVFPDPYLLFRLIMPPRRFKKKSVRKIVEKRVAKAIEKYEKTRADSNNVGGSGSTNTEGTVVPEMHGLKRLKKYIRGFPERIKGNITSSKPATLHEAINMAHELVEQSVQGRAARIGESNKRKWEDNQRNNNNNNHNYNNNHNNNNNNNRNQNNNHHQQQNRRPETVRAYVAAPAGGNIYAGNLPK
ncbi:hypothetical protein Tco_1124925 [Tanacetum coccineum]|uniref:Uncharacterized protein n=1 Tax=Tanacetum coccineum TaxID=301880 RepID=A0ABQ5J984_9ASTR